MSQINKKVNSVEEIYATIKSNSNRIQEIDKQLKEMSYKDKMLSSLAVESERLQIENKILKDNARVSLYNKTVENLVEVLKKYAGKPYGEKTKEKIRSEMIERCNVAVYLYGNKYGAIASFVPLNSQGYSGTMFSYDDFNIYGALDPETHERKSVLIDNKIKALKAEDFMLCDCKGYVENVTKKANEILEKFEELKTAMKDFENMCSDFNVLLPSSMDHFYPNNFKNYLV